MPTVAELLPAAVGLTRASCERLLGESIRTDDPMITTVQAERVLGLSSGQVLRLHRQGWLERHEAQLRRHYRLVDVLELAQPISVEAAAELIGCQPHQVVVPPDRALRTLDAVLQRGRRRRPPDRSWPFPDDDVVELSPVLVDEDAARWIGMAEASVILGVSYRTAVRMAAAGRLPAEKDRQNRWRAQYGKAILVRNALRARADRSAGRPITDD
ncbi:hypothetical protein ACFV9C_43900 [Kribbella sp. NPDC059898]|uniref:hypothetical protein n=1 Tax=Kribbella sp. NPDC059898 TaxID=3346995 RepID=UPI003649B8D5